MIKLPAQIDDPHVDSPPLPDRRGANTILRAAHLRQRRARKRRKGAPNEDLDRPHPHHPYRQPAAAETADRPYPAPREGRRRRAREAFEAEVAKAVDEVVAQQVAAGIDVVSDGEMSKPSYTTYIRHRVTGIEPDPRAAEKGATS